MEKKENGEIITNEKEIKQIVNTAYLNGAKEMTKQLQKLFQVNLQNFADEVSKQFENILASLTKEQPKDDK